MAHFTTLPSLLVLAVLGCSTLIALSKASSQGDVDDSVFEAINLPPNQNPIQCSGTSQVNGESVCPAQTSTLLSHQYYKCCPVPPNTAPAQCCYGGTSPNWCNENYERTGLCGVPT